MKWQRPILMNVMGVLECGPKVAVVLHPRVNSLLKEFASISRITRGGGMGFVVDALAKFFRADKVTLIRKTASDVEVIRFIHQTILCPAMIHAPIKVADFDARVLRHQTHCARHPITGGCRHAIAGIVQKKVRAAQEKAHQFGDGIGIADPPTIPG